MTTKSVTIKQSAYEALKSRKREGESFSDVVLRLTDSPTTEEQIASLSGGLDADYAEEVEASAERVGDALEMDSGRAE